LSSSSIALYRCSSCLTQVDRAAKVYGTTYYCPSCQKGTAWASFSAYICTCLGCGLALCIEGGILGALEVFCGQCKTKTPWLVYSGGRVCMWCGSKQT
jgi:hypothetical protein